MIATGIVPHATSLQRLIRGRRAGRGRGVPRRRMSGSREAVGARSYVRGRPTRDRPCRLGAWTGYQGRLPALAQPARALCVSLPSPHIAVVPPSSATSPSSGGLATVTGISESGPRSLRTGTSPWRARTVRSSDTKACFPFPPAFP